MDGTAQQERGEQRSSGLWLGQAWEPQSSSQEREKEAGAPGRQWHRGLAGSLEGLLRPPVPSSTAEAPPSHVSWGLPQAMHLVDFL